MQKCPTCPRCSAVFVVKDGRQHKKPLVLNCGHTFCESCLYHLAREQRTRISCPSCKINTELASGENTVKLLCPDRYIMGSVIYNQKTVLEHELARLKEMTESCGRRPSSSSGCSDSSQLFSEIDPGKLCKECGRRKATFYCPKCDCSMCAVCSKSVHSLSRSLQLHVPVSITEEGDVPVSQMCTLHENRTVEYYCDDDETVICSRCVIMGTHKGHNISSIEDKNRTIISDMEPKLQMANHVHRRLKKIDGELKAMIPDYKKELLPVLDEMRSHFQQLHGLLQIREYQMEQEILQTVKEGVGPFEKLKTELQNEYNQMGRTIKAAEKIMKNSDDVVVNAKEILDKLIHAKDIPCIIEEKPDGDSDVSIRFVEEPNLNAMLANYGKITGSIPQRFTMHTLREMPEKFSEDFEGNNLVSMDSETTRSTTPLSMESDLMSCTSEATSQSEDVIIEEEQEIVLDGGSTTGEIKSVKITSKKQNPPKKKPAKKILPTKKRFKGQHENVFVTHIHSPRKFMVQLKSDSSKISVLSHSLAQFCNSVAAKQHMVSHIEVEDLVLAQYSLDGKWYRSRVKNVIEPEDGQFNNINVEVVYIDYGNTEVVNVQKLRKMQDKFMKYPEFSVECSLFNLAPKNKDGTWSVEAVKTFAKMVEGRSMLLTIVREENNIMQVDLSKPADEDIIDDRPMSVRDALVFMDLAKMESTYSLTEPYGAPAQKRNYLTTAPKDEGNLYCVKLIYAGTPDCFYVQELGEEISYLATMMAHIQDTYQKQLKDSWQIISPQVGMICVSRFSGDGLWYRARIIELPGNRKITVQYVDYGNIETVDINKLRKILDSFLILPAQALCCSLTDVKPLEPDTTWSIEALQSWSDMVTMRTYMMKVISVDRCIMCIVLREQENDIVDSVNVQVIEKGIACSTGAWSLPQRMTEISNQMDEYAPRLSYQSGSGSFPEPCDAEHQPVYWKSRNSRPVRRYEETKLTPPSSPERPKSSQSQRKKSSEKNTVAKRLLRRSPLKEAPTATTDMNTDGGTSTEVSRESLPGKAAEVEVLVSHLVSPSEFYLQMSAALNGENGLERLMTELNNTYNNSEVVVCTWSKGKYCIAYSTKHDARWYRAKIVKCFQKSLVEVFMLDYGFTEVVTATNLRQIMRQYRKQRCFAFMCKLADVTPAGGMKEWSKTACEFMEDQTSNRSLLLIKKGGVEDGRLSVDIILVDYVEESALEPGRKTFHSLTEAIKERGLAIPVVKNRGGVQDEEKVFPVVYYKKAEAEVKSGDKVMPVYVDFDAVIHCYTMEGDDIFQSMCDTLHQKFKDSDAHGMEQQWIKRQACAAFYSKDNQWHRASIMEIEPSKIQVHFIDYGNSEWVGCEDVRADIAEFTDIPQQTFLCTLHDIHPLNDDEKWDMTTLDLMHKQLVNKYCIISIVEKFTYEDKPLSVNLELNGKDFGSYLVQHGLANRGQYITEEELQSAQIIHILQKKNPFQLMKIPKVGELLSVLVTHVELPNVVYTQPMRVNDTGPDGAASAVRNKQLDQLEILSAEINQTVHTLPVVPYPKPGVACCAQFSIDQCWYRAVIVCVYEETEQILVLFVDYGNSEITTINKLRAITPSFLQLPCQAVRCKLANIIPVNDVISWTKEALMKMIASVSNKPLLAKFIKHTPLSIELYEGSEENGFVYQSVIDDGYVQHDLSSGEGNGNTPTSIIPKIEYPTITVTVDREPDEDPSEGTVEAVDDSGKESKSWADMAENTSSVDLNELPELDDSDNEMSSSRSETTDSVNKRSQQRLKIKLTPGERQKIRDSRKVVTVPHDDECFD